MIALSYRCMQTLIFIVLMYQYQIMFIIFLDIGGSLLNPVSSLTFLAQP